MLKKRVLFISIFTALISLTGLVHAQNSGQTLQNPEQVVQAVEQYILNQASSYAGTASVHVSPPTIRNETACDDLQPYLPSTAKLRSRMTVTVRCQSPQPWTLRLKTELTIDGYYYMSNRTLNVGEVISLDDLVPREGDLLRLPPNTITDPSLAIGYITKQRINAGAAIKSNALRDAQSIERGQSVRTVAKGEGFIASGEGKALQGGAPGAQIQVRVSSGQVISGTVLDANTVQVF